MLFYWPASRPPRVRPMMDRSASTYNTNERVDFASCLETLSLSAQMEQVRRARTNRDVDVSSDQSSTSSIQQYAMLAVRRSTYRRGELHECKHRGVDIGLFEIECLQRHSLQESLPCGCRTILSVLAMCLVFVASSRLHQHCCFDLVSAVEPMYST